jgi:hypothetical protein
VSSIIKSQRTEFEQRLLAAYGRTDSPLIRVNQSENGQVVIAKGIEEALEAQYGAGDPKRMLAAMRETVSLAALALNDWPPQTIRILIDTVHLLEDMEQRSKNSLISYANKAGRRGKRKSSHYIVESRRLMLAAAVGRCEFVKRFDPAVTNQSFRGACDWVCAHLNKSLKPFGQSLDTKMRGKWSTTTPERAERRKPAPTWGERVEGWLEEFKDDSSYQYRLQKLYECLDEREAVEHFIAAQLNSALERLVRDTV